MFRAICVLIVTVFLSACGGNSVSLAPKPTHPTTAGDVARALAWRDSPIDPTRSYINTDAIEPGEYWTDDRVEVESVSMTVAETERFIPLISFRYYGEARQLDYTARDNLEAAVRRAFKVWTRYLESDRYGNRYGEFLVEVGPPCGRPDAVACANREMMRIPESTAQLVQGGISISLFGVLAHEVGHMLGYDDNPYLPGVQPHAPSFTRQLMAPHLGDSKTVTPQYDDLVGIGGSYRYAADPAASDHFGWWLEIDPRRSNLRQAGVKVMRTLVVDENLDGIALAQGIEADALVSDFIKVAAFVDGIPTPPNLIPHLGSARWDGVLLAVDTRTFEPVFGTAALVANLDALSIRAAFDNLEAYDGLEWADWREASLTYTLRPVRGSDVWSDGRAIDARFFARQVSPVDPVEPAGLIAGRLNDTRADVTGAYAAGRK